MFGACVTWRQRAVNGVDADGNNTYATVSETRVFGASYAPGPSIETVQGQDMVVDKPSLYVPPGVVPSPLDQFVVDGDDFDVSGNAAIWKSRFTAREPGNVILLIAVAG